MDTSVTSSRALIASAALIAAIVVSATAVACGSDDNTIAAPKAPTYVATLNGAGERPDPKAVPGTGTATIVKNGTTYTYTITYTGMTGALVGAHIHGPAGVDAIASVIVPFDFTGAGPSGTLTGTFAGTNNVNVTPDSLDKLMTSGNAYVNLHTAANGGGEIRGQLSKQQ